MAFGIGSQAYFANFLAPHSGGSSSGSGEVMVYRPGGVTIDNVYATWGELYTAYSLTDGQITIEIDDSIVTPAPIPAGAYTIRPDAIFKGIIRTPTVKTVLEFQDGATFTNLPYVTTNLQVDSVSTTAAIVFNDGALHAIVVDFISILSNTGGLAPGLVQLEGNGTSLFLLVHDFSLIQGGQVFYAVDPGAGAPIFIAAALTGTQPTINQDTFASDPGANATLGIDSLSDTESLNTTQTNWGGSLQIGGANPRTFWRPTSVNTSTSSATPGTEHLCDPSGGTFDVDLPETTSLVGGETVVIKNVTSSAIPINIVPFGADTIDGLASIVISEPFGAVILVANNERTEWNVIARTLGGAYSTLIYRPGGVQGGNVFTSWADLYAVYSASDVVTTIEIDSTIVSPAVVPAGAYIWRDDLTMQGDYFLGSYLQLADNVVFNQLPFIDQGLLIESVSNTPIIDLGNSGINVNVILDNYSFLTANGTAVFIENASSVYIVNVEARFGSGFQTGAMAVLNLTDPGGGVAYAHVGAFEGTNISGQIQDDTISSGGGNVQVDRELISSSGQISNNQTGYTSALFPWMDPATFDVDDRVIFRPTDDVKIADYTASPSEVVRCDPTAAGFNVTLPDPFPPAGSGVDVVYNGTTVIVKNVSNSANQITILPDGNSTIDGAVSFNMIGARLSVTLVYFGDDISGDWMVV